MKKIKKNIMALFAMTILSLLFTVSCDSFSNMSQEDAYYIGAGIGTATRVLLDN